MKHPHRLSRPQSLFAPFFLAAALIAGAAAGKAAAADHGTHGGHAAKPAANAEASLIEGLVKKVDKAGGKVTVSHGPLPNGMPAMTMTFRVKEAAWIDRLKDGQKIRFAADQIDGAMTLVRIETL